MRRRRLVGAALVLVVAAPVAAERAGKAAPSGGAFFDFGGTGKSKEPITITADRLEYDYKANVVVYRGRVEATQGTSSLKADVLTVTLDRQAGDTKPAGEGPSAPPAGGGSKVREIVAVGSVRIDQGTRWATGGRAVFDQGKRTFTLTETPLLHDADNEVAGDTVVVYLDENRSVVEGGRKRVKAVLHPSNKNDDKSDAAASPPAAPEEPATVARP
ncbi:MAG: LptA/OstA family protein [Candidatus Binatia bacterium]